LDFFKIIFLNKKSCIENSNNTKKNQNQNNVEIKQNDIQYNNPNDINSHDIFMNNKFELKIQ